MRVTNRNARQQAIGPGYRLTAPAGSTWSGLLTEAFGVWRRMAWALGGAGDHAGHQTGM